MTTLGSATLRAYTGRRPDVIAHVPRSAKRILDVGCSSGALGAALRELSPQRRVAGIEMNADLARQARAVLHRVIEADVDHLAWTDVFADEKFDCVIFADVLEHVTDPWRVVREANAVIEPGGAVVVSVPNIRHLSALCAIFWSGTFPTRDRGLFDRTHLRWFTLRDVLQMLQEAGFAPSQVSAHIRLFDEPGGRANIVVERALRRFQHWAVVREFLGYQLVILARKRPGPPS